MPENISQITQANSNDSLIVFPNAFPDTLTWWADQYFRIEVTTSEKSRREQRRDIAYFIQFMKRETETDLRDHWIPRLSSAFQETLRNTYQDGKRHWSDRTINRMMAHLKTFSKWIHKLKPFPLGNPMEKIKLMPVGTGLEIERALTPTERRRMLDFADQLIVNGGRSKDRNRYKDPTTRPIRKGYRAYRNRAIIYTLIETGMRRGAIPKTNLNSIDFKNKSISVQEKGGLVHSYKISNQGLQAIRDYLDRERDQDSEKNQSPALFLAATTKDSPNERLSSWTVNQIWNDVAKTAGIEGKTPHSARHAMGKHIIEKTGNIAAVQRQLGHKNAMYSMLYARITGKELESVLNDRE